MHHQGAFDQFITDPTLHPVLPKSTALRVRQPAMQLVHHVAYLDVLPEFVAFCIVVVVNAQALAEAVQHLDYLSRLPLGPQVHLKVKVITSIHSDAYPVLLDQH